MELVHEIKSIPDADIFRNYIIRWKVNKSKRILKQKLLNKSEYNAFDIIGFIQLLKYALLVDYIKHDDELSYTYSTYTNSANANSASLSYSIEYGDCGKLNITYKASVLNGLDTEGSISMEWIIADNNIKQIDHKLVSSNEVSYSENVKTIGRASDTSDKNKMALNQGSYEILHDVFLIYIEKIFDGIERKYMK